MKIKLEWHSANANEEQKKKVGKAVKADINRDRNSMKRIPEKLTVSLFDVPHTQLLKGSGLDDNGEELVSFTYSLVDGNTTYHY